MTHRLCAFNYVLLLLLAAPQQLARAQEDRNELVAALNGIAQVRDSLHSLKVLFAEITQTSSTNEFRYSERDVSVHLITCGFTEDRCFSQIQTVADERNTLQHVGPALYLSESEFVKWWPNLRFAVRTKSTREFIGSFFDDNHYFQALGLRVAEVTKTGQRADHMGILEALASERYEALDAREMVDGALCLKLSDGAGDELWLDPATNYLPRKRLWRVWPTESSGGSAFLFELKDWRPVAQGIKLPWVVHVTRFEAKQGDPAEGLPYITNQILVGGISVNELTEADLKVKFPPGSLIVDEPSGRRTILAGGEELLETIAGELRQRTAIASRHNVASGFMTISGIYGMGLTALLLAAFYAAFQRRVSKTNAPRLAGSR